MGLTTLGSNMAGELFILQCTLIGLTTTDHVDFIWLMETNITSNYFITTNMTISRLAFNPLQEIHKGNVKCLAKLENNITIMKQLTISVNGM